METTDAAEVVVPVVEPAVESKPAPEAESKPESEQPKATEEPAPAEESKAAPVDTPMPAEPAPEAGASAAETKPAEDAPPAAEVKDAAPPAAEPAAGGSSEAPAEEEEPKVIASKPLATGDTLPDLPSLETEESTDAAKKTISVSDMVKSSGVVIFLYCRANTPGCTNQATGFRDNIDALKTAGYQVVGISADKPKAQATWKTKNNLPFHLLCDPTFEAIKALGANKGEKGISRSHIVVEKGGNITQALYNIKPKDSVSAAVQKATGRPAILPTRTPRKPYVYEEEIDEDEPPRSKLDEPPLSGKRRSKPSSKKVEAEQDALEIGNIVEDEEEEDDDEDMPRKKGRGGRR